MSRARIPKAISLFGALVSGFVDSVHHQVFIAGKYKPNKQKHQHKTEKNYYVVHHHWNRPKPK